MLSFLLAALLLGASPDEKQRPPGDAPSPEAASRPALSRSDGERTARAIRRGLGALRREMEKAEDGAVPRGEAEEYAPVGVTALAALAFLGDGTAQERGLHAPVLERALRYLLAKSDRSGSPRDGYIATDGDTLSKMHGHGYATLALAEAYGMFRPRVGREGHEPIRESLERAVRLIERSQGETGGWYYEPERSLEHEGSVTVCLIQALRAARNAGIAVNKKVIDDALDYLRRSQRSDGSFRYHLGSDQTSPALTAAGVATLQAMGEYGSEAVESGIGCLLRWTEGTSLASFGGASAFPQYQRFYTAQAFFHYRDPQVFERWFRGERDRLLRTQEEDGTWEERSTFGVAYTTATNVLVLEIPLGLLPIFQR
ncbi:MAG: hypothetical protein L0323_21780 [Planctomycetes bacterium]|nr:hypothetical protein [Planctomycetota bacterium]